MTKKKSPAKSAGNPARRPVGSQTATATISHQTYEHSGPLPDPQTLFRYNDIIPDAAERILAMAEQNADHYRQLEKTALEAQIADNTSRHDNIKRGQFAGILSVATSFALAGYALYLGQAAVSATICSVTVIGLVTIFITGRKPENPQEKIDEK